MRWLDRGLIVGPYFTLVLSQKECNKAFAHCELAKEDWVPWIRNEHSDATVHYLTNPKKELVCIVAVRLREGVNGVQVASMLVHEAVHIWQEFRKRIGEDRPSDEFEAYAIQSISQRLLEEYAERVGNAQ